MVSVTSSPLYISRPGTRRTDLPQSYAGLHCGTRTQPWLLEAPAGQRINISLIDFTPTGSVHSAALTVDSLVQDNARWSGSSSSSISATNLVRNKRCSAPNTHSYGYVIDKAASAAAGKNVSICSSNSASQRSSNVHLSTGSVVELVLTSHGDNSDAFNFLLGIEGELLIVVKKHPSCTSGDRFFYFNEFRFLMKTSLFRSYCSKIQRQRCSQHKKTTKTARGISISAK